MPKRLQRPKTLAGDDLTILVASAEREYPGILELLEVYGGYAQALRDAQDYLAYLQPQTTYTVSSTSS